MAYRLAAMAVMLLHTAFLLFALLGGLLLPRLPALVWLHLPVLLWAVGIAVIGWTCPLTVLENRLRQAGRLAAYNGGFIEHYFTDRCYPEGLPRHVLAVMGLFVLLVNIGSYGYWLAN